MDKLNTSSLIYNIHQNFERKTFIGYGSKSDFTKFKKSYANYYYITREFDNLNKANINFKNAPLYSFGLSKIYVKKSK